MNISNSFPGFRIFSKREFWSKAACKRLRNTCRNSSKEEARVYLQGKLQSDNNIRKTRRILLNDTLREEIQESLLSIQPELENYFQISLTGMQPFQLLEYRPGNYFRTHQDEGRPVSELARKISVIIFLNSNLTGAEDGFTGGDLVLYQNPEQSLAGDGLHSSAEEGLLIAFSSYLLHEVREVTAGVRYSIVSWFY